MGETRNMHNYAYEEELLDYEEGKNQVLNSINAKTRDESVKKK